MQSQRYLHTRVHGSIIHKSQKTEATQRLSLDKWIKNGVYIVNSLLVLKRKEILTYFTTWMNPENISEIQILHNSISVRNDGSEITEAATRLAAAGS